jgi:hypothetical protein
MKQVKNALTTVAFGLTLSLAVTGCGVPGANSLGDSLGSPGGSGGSDSLSVKQDGAQGFYMEWNKKSGGYSEVGLSASPLGSGERAQTQLLTDNFTGKHTLACGYSRENETYVYFDCYGTGPSVTGGTRQIAGTVFMAKRAEFSLYLTYGASSSGRHSDDTGYRLRYDNGSLSVKKR